MLDRLLVLLREFGDRLDRQPTFGWAVVVSVAPLTIRYDAQADAIAGTPDRLVGRLSVGDRVWCQRIHRRDIVLGVAKGGVGAADGVYAFTPSSGWSIFESHDSYLEVRDGWAYLRVNVRIAAGGSFNSILTVPTPVRPPKAVFVGTYNTSAGSSASGALYLTADGVLSGPNDYRQGTLAAGGYLPIAVSWRVS